VLDGCLQLLAEGRRAPRQPFAEMDPCHTHMATEVFEATEMAHVSPQETASANMGRAAEKQGERYESAAFAAPPRAQGLG